MTKKKKPLVSKTLTCDDCDKSRTFEASTKAKLTAVIERTKWGWYEGIDDDLVTCGPCSAKHGGEGSDEFSEGPGEMAHRRLKNRHRRALRDVIVSKMSLSKFERWEDEQRQQREQEMKEMQVAGELNTLPAQYARQESDLLIDLQLQTNRLKILTYAQQIKLRFLRMNPQERQLFLNALTADNKNGFGNLFDLEKALTENNPDWRSSDAVSIERARVRAITQGKTIEQARVVAQNTAWSVSAIRHTKKKVNVFLAQHLPKFLLPGSSKRLQLAGKVKAGGDTITTP